MLGPASGSWCQCHLDEESVLGIAVTLSGNVTLVVHLLHLALEDLVVVPAVCDVADLLDLVPAILLSLAGALTLYKSESVVEHVGVEVNDVVVQQPLDLGLRQSVLPTFTAIDT